MSPKKSPAKAKSDKRRLVIFDGHGIIYRAYYAFRDPLTVRKTGEVVSGVFGFANTLLTVLDELKPTHVAVALDPPGPTFRHEMDQSYKANRFQALQDKVLGLIADTKAPAEAKDVLVEAVEGAKNSEEVRTQIAERVAALDVSKKVKEALSETAVPAERLREIAAQTERVRELIAAFGIPLYMERGYEADDVLGTLARQGEEAGIETYLVTLDADIIQLITKGVKVFMMRPSKSDTVVYDEKAAREHYKIEPHQMPDFKGLTGDSSDNISGVPGIGKVAAVALLQQFDSIEDIYEHIEDVTPNRRREILREHEELARHSKSMATIEVDVPVTLDLAQAELENYDRESVVALFTELEFKSLIPRLPEKAAEGNGRGGAATVLESGEYSTVYTEAELEALAARLTKAKAFALSTETTDPNALRTPIAGIAVSWAPGKAAYVPTGHRPGLGDTAQLTLETVIAKLRPVLEDDTVKKTGHNIKFDIEVLAAHGVELRGVAFDTLIASYLLGEGGGDSNKPSSRSIALQWLAAKRLDIEMAPVTELLGTGAKAISIVDVTAEQASPFACSHADMTGRLQPGLEADLRERDLWPLFSEIEMPLVAVLARMEATGVAVDTDALREMSLSLGEQVVTLQSDAFDAVGHDFNLGSPQQLSQLFFEELGLPKTRKTKQGYTTDATALDGLRGAHPVVEILLEWRQLTKLKSTYIDSLPALVNPKTSRIHTYYNQTVAATGRLSSQ
ncbi:MAG: hypothetical protein IIC89_08640, partial [Chloroflexi bacterium]|nr:hypothetical protein [Chloroflexota bacterium]